MAVAGKLRTPCDCNKSIGTVLDDNFSIYYEQTDIQLNPVWLEADPNIAVKRLGR